MRRFFYSVCLWLCMSIFLGSCTVLPEQNGEETATATATATPTLVQTLPTPTPDTFDYPAEKEGKRCGLKMQEYISKNSKSETIKALARGEKKTIVAYGTSLTQYEGWVTDLKTIFKFKYGDAATVINSGQGATDSVWGKANVKERVTQYVPDLVILEFSMNDAVADRNISPQQGIENLMFIIEETQKVNPNCEFVLMTMNVPLANEADWRPNLDAYYETYRQTAKEKGFFFVDNVETWKKILAEDAEQYQKYMPDNIHPTIAAHRKVTLKNLMDVLY